MLLTRRMMLALLTISSDEGGYLFIILMVSLCLYLMAHVAVQPFKYKRVNRMESVCIFVLIVVLGFVNGTDFGSDDDDDLQVLISLFLFFMMLIPMLIVLYQGIQFCRNSGTCCCFCCGTKKISKKRYDKIKNRNTSYTESEVETVEMANDELVDRATQ